MYKMKQKKWKQQSKYLYYLTSAFFFVVNQKLELFSSFVFWYWPKHGPQSRQLSLVARSTTWKKPLENSRLYMRTVHSCQNNIHRTIAGTITRGSCNILFAMGLSFYSVIVKCFPACMFVCILHPSLFGVLAVFWQHATIISSFDDDDDIRPKRRHSMKYQNENDQRKTHTITAPRYTQKLEHIKHKWSLYKPFSATIWHFFAVDSACKKSETRGNNLIRNR